MSDVEWTSEAESLYSQVVERVPDPYRAIVTPNLRRSAEARAHSSHRRTAPDDVIVGFFDFAPKAFWSQIVANLEGLGIDCTPYLNGEAGSSSSPERGLSLDRMLIDLKEMSSLVNARFDEGKTKAAILAFGDGFRHSPVAMRTTTRSKASGDLSVRYLNVLEEQPVDPLAIAQKEGFVHDDGHPVFELFRQARDRCGAIGYGVDVEVGLGFSKVWMAPSLGLATLDAVASLPGLPESAKNAISHFDRFGLDHFGLFGFDFVHKSVNLYFMIKEPLSHQRDYSALLSDIGYRTDRAEVLHACNPAHTVYYSFTWRSAHVERVCFATVCANAKQVPVSLDPIFGRCLGHTGFMHGLEASVYAVVCAPETHYFKLDNDYSGSMAKQLIDAGEAGV